MCARLPKHGRTTECVAVHAVDSFAHPYAPCAACVYYVAKLLKDLVSRKAVVERVAHKYAAHIARSPKFTMKALLKVSPKKARIVRGVMMRISGANEIALSETWIVVQTMMKMKAVAVWLFVARVCLCLPRATAEIMLSGAVVRITSVAPG